MTAYPSSVVAEADALFKACLGMYRNPTPKKMVSIMV